ncbi:transferase [Aspergillus granulosus]|uniref:Transferase n=1 Tax=Aspergillus granulosus TaxID=176169 RepID=A0ABR4I3Q8_9EURO
MPTDISYVRPNNPLVPEIVKLSPIDQFTIRVYTPLLLCFKTELSSSDTAICSVLKQSLANVLDSMSWFAGTICTANKAHGTVELCISEDDAVPFKVQDLRTDPRGNLLDFDGLTRDHFPPSRLDPSILLPGSIQPGPVAPCLEVQVNFIRGGLILATNTHHSVVDGCGIGVFWKHWAREAAAISQGLIVPLSERFPREALDRWPLFPVPGKCPPAMSEYPGFTNQGVAGYIRETSGLTISCWRISRDSLQELIRQVQAGTGTDNPGTQNSVLSAFLLRHFTRARQLGNRGVTTVAAFGANDIRARMDPPLHPDYPGNAVAHSKVTFPLTQVVSPGMDSLAKVSFSILESVEWWTPERIRQMLSSMQTHPQVRGLSRSMDLEADTCLEVSNTSNMPVYSAFWGHHLGSPVSVRLPHLPILDGQVRVFPRLPDGGIELLLFTHETVVERMKGDSEFTKFVEYYVMSGRRFLP